MDTTKEINKANNPITLPKILHVIVNQMPNLQLQSQ